MRALEDWRRTGAARTAERLTGAPPMFVSLARTRAPEAGGELLSAAAVGDVAVRYAAAGVPADRRLDQ